MSRRTCGVLLLIVSAIYSSLDLMGVMRPMFLRWRAHGGIDRTFAVLLGSLSFRAVLLLTAAILSFWPDRPKA